VGVSGSVSVFVWGERLAASVSEGVSESVWGEWLAASVGVSVRFV
jgi:hypothetical protein